MTDKIYYTYIYFDPSRDNEAIYVGKGKNKRAAKHLLRSDKHPFTQRLQKMKSNGVEPFIYFILQKVTEQEAFDKEVELITKYGRKDLGKGTLLNLTDGGNTPGAWNKGKKMTPEHKENHKKALEAKGLKSWHEGYIHTNESKEKMSNAHIGKALSKESIEKREATKIANGSHKVGDKIKVTYLRNSKENTVDIVLGANNG